MRIACAVLLLNALLCSAPAAEEPAVPPRKPVPDDKLLKDAEALVRDFFKAEYAKMGPLERGALAKKLLQEAGQTNTDMDLKFVLLREARTMALEGGCVDLALRALDATGATFEFDAAKEKTDLLSQLARSAKTPEASRNVANACLGIAEELLAKNRYEEARPPIGQAEMAAKSVKDEEWQKETQRRIKDAQDLLREYDNVAPSLKKLQEKPDDAEAAGAAGRFLCFIKGDWPRGLVLLARSSDPSLKKAAQLEVAGPADALAQARLGDAWWQQAKSLSGKARLAVQEHAVYWLQKALPGLEDDLRELATKTIVAFYMAALEQGQTGAAFQLGNVALLKNGATLSQVHEGGRLAPAESTAMLDGNTTEYTGHTGFTSASFPCAWIVTLPKAYLLQEIRLLLWDGEDRYYRYILETSLDGKTYETVVDCSKGEWRSWQVLHFAPRLVKYIRLKGLYNSSNGGFHVVELEAYCIPPATPVKPKYPSVKGGDGGGPARK